MRYDDIREDLDELIVSEEQILARLDELAREVERDYEGSTPLILGVLKGAVMVVSDFARALRIHADMDWMAVSSYGTGTVSSGVVKILKDLDTDVTGRDVLIVEDIIDSGLTLAWLRDNLISRGAKSVKILTALRKPDAVISDVVPDYLGFDIPNKFIVGYGCDYAEKYRNLRDVAVLSPKMYS
ncbi:MAG: hypoxanthine phosphoribosyltransferase [Actinomycetota bacterium]|jgi:hypoxanthine phosphoribosyltransferase